jgi:hypothetical protein
MNDQQPARPRKVADLTHRAAGLDRGLSGRRSQTIATAVQTFGYDPAAAERARAAEPRPLGLTIRCRPRS